MSRSPSICSWILAAVCAASFVVASSPELGAPDHLAAWQDPVQDPPTDPPGGRAGRQGGGANQGPRPYAQVITSAAKTDEGVFKVHRANDTLYFEIPTKELDKDFVWDVSIKKTTLGAGFGAQNVSSRVVRWSKRGDRILLQSIDYSITGGSDEQVSQAVANSNYPAIIRTLPVAAYGLNGEALVDVTALVMEQGGGGGGGGGGVPEFSVAGAIGGRGTDQSRSFLKRAVSFPENINVEATLTFTSGGAAGGGGGSRRSRRPDSVTRSRRRTRRATIRSRAPRTLATRSSGGCPPPSKRSRPSTIRAAARFSRRASLDALTSVLYDDLRQLEAHAAPTTKEESRTPRVPATR
jgi:hypothetical protein